MSGSIRRFYADWAGYSRRTIDAIRGMSAEDLALRAPGSDHWPIWAIAAHTGTTRIYWLCHVFGEPGAERTPFVDPSGYGWEDDLATPRTADEVADALASTWSVVEGCLDRWSAEDMELTARRDAVQPQVHSRQSIILRLINHEAYHVGEINIALASTGREPIDLWPGREWEAGAPRSLREGPGAEP